MTQMLVSGYWTTAFSHDVFYYSINLAVYLLALGLGSLLSNRFKQPTLKTLTLLILALLAVTGVAIPFLRLGIKQFGNVILFPLLVVFSAGTLNGTVIPLCLKLGEKYSRMSLGLLFFIDYCAASLFAFLFAFVLLIPLGYSKTGLVMSCLSSFLVIGILGWQKALTRSVSVFILAVILFPVSFYFVTGAHVAPRMDRTGTARIIHNEQSHYQKIILTEEESPKEEGDFEHILFLDGFIQFSSSSEKAYHLCLADIPSVAASFQQNPIEKILILGGGDGLAARNFLKSNRIKKLTLVELDPAMIRLAKEHPIIKKYNMDSLSDPRVEIVVQDAFRWVREQQTTQYEKYDLIVIDFPAPKNLTLARLFSAEFYSSVFKLLSPKGFVSIQAGPSYSFEDPTRTTLSKVTASIMKTIGSIGYPAFPYVNPQDSEAFILSTKDSAFDMEKFSRKIGIYTGAPLSLFCRFDKGWKNPPVEKNTLNTLRLSRYMLDWFKQIGDSYFYYRGNHLIFLPE
jgi:spermidine synthase